MKTFSYFRPVQAEDGTTTVPLHSSGTLRDLLAAIKAEFPKGGVAPSLGVVFDTEGNEKGKRVRIIGLVFPSPTADEIKEALAIKTVKAIREAALTTFLDKKYAEHLKEHPIDKAFVITTELAGEK